MSLKILIAGGGCAALEAAVAARQADDRAEITLCCQEAVAPYRRPALTKMLAGADSAQFWLKKPEFYAENRIRLELDSPITALDPAAHTATIGAGRVVAYDRLLLATGGAARTLPWPNADLPGISGCRTLADLEAIRADVAAGTVRRVAVIGGGLLGLEMADALREGGLAVTVIEGVDRLLPRQLDAAGSAMLARIVTASGAVELRLGARVAGFTGTRRVTGVTLDSGEVIATELVILAIGMTPNDQLAAAAGLAVDRGVVTDERCRTSAADIFAAGDCARVAGFNLGLWIPAKDQGIVAGRNMTGGDAVFTPEPAAARLAAFGTRLFSLGTLSGDCCRSRVDEAVGSARSLYSSGGRLSGAMLLGDLSGQLKIQDAVRTGAAPETVEE